MAYLVTGGIRGYDGLTLPPGTVLRFHPSGAGFRNGLVASRPPEAAITGLTFAVWLESTDEVTPLQYYTVVAEWPDGAGGFTQISIWDKFYVPVGGGDVSTFPNQPISAEMVWVGLDSNPPPAGFKGLWLEADELGNGSGDLRRVF